MQFTIYTLGDVEAFRAALTGVAMVFKNDGMFTSSSTGVGLGMLAGFGLMIALAFMLIQGVMKQKIEIGEFIMLIMAFSVMFVPKFDVQIEDYYDTGQIAKVSDAPLGVVFPAAMMSTIVKNVNDTLAGD